MYVPATQVCPLDHVSTIYLTPRQCWNRLAQPSSVSLTQESADIHKPHLQWLQAACTIIGPTRHPANLSEIPSYPFVPS
jgi:hypothetical protein